MKQSQKNYLVQRLTGVYHQKRYEIGALPQPKVTAADIRNDIRASGLKVVTQAALVDEIVRSGGYIPSQVTPSYYSDSASFSFLANYKEYTELQAARNKGFNAATQEKYKKLEALFTAAKDKIILGDDASGALEVLKELQDFKV